MAIREAETFGVQQTALQHGLQSFCIIDNGTIIFASKGYSAAFGIAAGDAVDRLSALVSADDVATVVSALGEARDTGREVCVMFDARRLDGTCARVAATIARIDAYREQPLLFAIGHMDEHEGVLAELKLLAFKDPLTGVANRASLLDECRIMLQRCKRKGGMLGVLLADLDGFKAINDAHGHAVGDEVLVRVARAMQDAVREGDIVGRLGGDEFAVALPRLAGVEDAALVAGRLIRGVAECARESAGVLLGMSVGIAIWPADADNIDELFARADRAMYWAKRHGKNRYCLADEAGDAHCAKPLHFLDWGVDRDLGVAEMDGDHRALAALINELGDELKSGADGDKLFACMDRLVSHTAAHFAREEQWMDAYDYPHSAVHKGEHTRLLEDLAGLSMRLDTRSMVLTMRYLQDWLCRHVDESDRELAAAMLASASRAPRSGPAV
ncbi:MAG TPA: bacteriohemerythrin [Burkholderiales bacterium]|nr:bacteriohemerythrin [Burkholderiales bacterium]